ncbi:hypothetical protein FRAAL3575 [Frankia alni ACN14a]|uniref:Uncharacterized protein n=1 Tax=Frankia alni (strain DSM 45986 / CECT 9034 / ACN14a) TaxID=326424 RepID=Q0RJU2_FRAAA|nr:hypothetical protein FRAAL3575 [Frankia alni ACN14a]
MSTEPRPLPPPAPAPARGTGSSSGPGPARGSGSTSGPGPARGSGPGPATNPSAEPDGLARTRRALHAVAEHVLAAARYRATGRIGLAVTPGGFATPAFGPAGRTVAVAGTDLVVRDGDAETARSPLTTLREAAHLAGVEPGGPAAVYRLATPCHPDEPLDIDPDAARLLADWFALGAAALRRWSVEIAADAPSPPTLWPEHFDLAIRAGQINYGLSPGDEAFAAPYAYVGPPLPPPSLPTGFWNASFGAARTWTDVGSVDAVVDLFRQARRHAST